MLSLVPIFLLVGALAGGPPTPSPDSEPLVRSSLPAEGLDTAAYDALKIRIAEGAWRNTHAILVARDGRLLIDDYFLGDDRATLQDIRSCTKSVASILVGIAIDQRFLEGVDQELMDFFPDYQRPSDWDPRKDDITLHHMLTMSWGIDAPDFESSQSFTSIERYRVGWVEELLSLPVAYDPGSRYVYSSAATCMFAPILERATGMPVEVFAERYLFQPLGITDYRWTPLPDGYPMIGGALWIRPDQWLRLGLLYLREGEWNGRAIVSPEWVRRSTSEQIEVSPEVNIHYGYYWATDQVRIHGAWHKGFHHTGHGGSILGVIPDLNMVFAVKGSAHHNPWHNLRTRAMLDTYVLPSVLPNPGPRPYRPGWRSYPWVPILLCFIIFASGLMVWTLALWRGAEHPIRLPAVFNMLYSLCAGFLLLALLLAFGEMRYLPNIDYPTEFTGFKRFLIHVLPRILAGSIPVLFAVTAVAWLKNWWTLLQRWFQTLTAVAGLGFILILVYMRIW
jgi:CubicO group peptidase (beta-lactamase class C family)